MGNKSKIWFFLVVAGCLLLVPFLSSQIESQVSDYSEFKAKIRSGAIKRVQLDKDVLIGFAQPSPAADAGRPASAWKSGEGEFRSVPIADPGLLPLLDSMRI